MEKETEVKTFYVEKVCEKEQCSGTMESQNCTDSNNYLITADKTYLWKHVCNICKNEEFIKKIYPRYTHRKF
jgi:hypothetical protein